MASVEKDNEIERKLKAANTFLVDTIHMELAEIISKAEDLAFHKPYVGYVLHEIAKQKYLDGDYDLKDIYRELTFFNRLNKLKTKEELQGKKYRLSYLNDRMRETLFGRIPRKRQIFDSTSEESKEYKEYLATLLAGEDLTAAHRYVFGTFYKHFSIDDPNVSEPSAEDIKEYNRLEDDCQFLVRVYVELDNLMRTSQHEALRCQDLVKEFLTFIGGCYTGKISISESFNCTKPVNQTLRQKIEAVETSLKRKRNKLSETTITHYEIEIQNLSSQLKNLLAKEINIPSSGKEWIDVMDYTSPLEKDVRLIFVLENPFSAAYLYHERTQTLSETHYAWAYYLVSTQIEYERVQEMLPASDPKFLDYCSFYRKREPRLEETLELTKRAYDQSEKENDLDQKILSYIEGIIQTEIDKKAVRDQEKATKDKGKAKAHAGKQGKSKHKKKK